MPSLVGQVESTIYTANGQPAITITWFFDNTTRVLRTNPAQWTAPDGTVYPAGSGALIVDNALPKQIRVEVNVGGTVVRWIDVPASTNRAFSPTQLANISPANGGPYTTAADFNGVTFSLA